MNQDRRSPSASPEREMAKAVALGIMAAKRKIALNARVFPLSDSLCLPVARNPRGNGRSNSRNGTETKQQQRQVKCDQRSFEAEIRFRRGSRGEAVGLSNIVSTLVTRRHRGHDPTPFPEKNHRPHVGISEMVETRGTGWGQETIPAPI